MKNAIIDVYNIGKVKVKIEKARKTELESCYSPYARMFDMDSDYWRPDVDVNWTFLLQMQHYFNMKLQSEGKVYINDVYEALGIARVPEYEKLVGWVYLRDNPVGDSYVDFGLYLDADQVIKGRYKYGYKAILLDFNACDISGCL